MLSQFTFARFAGSLLAQALVGGDADRLAWPSLPVSARELRSANATNVSVGPYPEPVGNSEESAISTFGASQSRPHGSQTLVAGSRPMRAVPTT